MTLKKSTSVERLAAIAVLAITSVANLFAGDAKKEAEEFPPQPPIPLLSVEETIKKFELPEGYSIELVVGDPDIKEPVVLTFDGNGRMYIAEMRSYMQDIDGKDEHTPVGLVSRHESTKHDGVYDKHTVFAEKLVLPRMVMPLDERVLINETDTNDIYVYSDTNGDGVSDKKELFYEGGKRGGNLEHQPSGLVWCMDNWIYSAGNAYRLRYDKGKCVKESIPGNAGQWGCAQDDFGKPWFSQGGGERSWLNFQTHIEYGAINHPDQYVDEFLTVWPLVGLADVQGGHARHREDKTLNHFTASCGQTFFRGDRLPADIRGNAFIGEPVGRLIRRAVVEVKEGVTYISNPYEKQKSEFIRSRDPNFRPVNMTTGPDGCLYIVDMHRGIIQEGAWVNEGSYLRKVVKQYSMDKIYGHGRIWRLRHKDFQPGPQPHMLDETPAQLVEHLTHPNGWWRDTAQQLIVMRGDKSVVPALTALAKSHENSLTRMHALWTLEGLGALDKALVEEKFKDSNPQVRIAAIRAAETLIKAGDATLQPEIMAMSKDPDCNVVMQVFLTAKLFNWPNWKDAMQVTLMTNPAKGIKDLGKAMLAPPPAERKDIYTAAEIKLLKQGDEIFKELCFGCHGFDGKGMPLQGAAPGLTMAPPLGGSELVQSHRDAMVYVLMNGLSGPVNGKTYDAQMVPMNTNTDDWIASAASYVRNSFGNHGALVTPADVKRIRAAVKERKTPWTREEILAMLPQPLQNKSQWKVSAEPNNAGAPLAIDGKADTRYDTHTAQAPGQWYQVELPEETMITSVKLDYAKSHGDFPRGYKLEFSLDGKKWDKISEGKGQDGMLEVDFAPRKTKFIKITQTGSQAGTFWSIHEINILAPAKNASSADAGSAPAGSALAKPKP